MILRGSFNQLLLKIINNWPQKSKNTATAIDCARFLDLFGRFIEFFRFCPQILAFFHQIIQVSLPLHQFFKVFV